MPPATVKLHKGKRRGTTSGLKIRLLLAVGIIPAAIIAQFISRFAVSLRTQWALQDRPVDTARGRRLPADYDVVPLEVYAAPGVDDVLPQLRYAVGDAVCGAPKPPACTVVQLGVDDGVREWVAAALATGRRGAYSLALYDTILKFGVPSYDVQALLGQPVLFLMSEPQWRQLLSPFASLTNTPALFSRGLDVGAGNGDLTTRFAGLVEDMVATEATLVRATRLQWAGFTSHATVDVDVEFADHPGFDVVFSLNVLDRVYNPATFIESLVAVANPGGLLVLSVPLPHKPVGTPTSNQLTVKSGTWEGSASQLVALLQYDHGLDVVAVTRAPYLCTGSFLHPLFALDALVVVARTPLPARA